MFASIPRERLFRLVLGCFVVSVVVFVPVVWGGWAPAQQQQQQQRRYRISEFLSPDLEASLEEEEEDALLSLSSYSIALHRNGEPEACGSTIFSLSLLDQALELLLLLQEEEDNEATDGSNSGDLNRYQVESLLTEWVHQQENHHEDEIGGEEARWLCPSLDPEDATSPLSGFLGYCDMGITRTVPQPDSDRLVPVPSSGSLPCRFYTREGLRITSLNQLATLVFALQDSYSSSSSEQEQQSCTSESADPTASCNSNSTDSFHSKETILRSLDLYAVPAGRVFMFPAGFVGERFELPHVAALDPTTKEGNPDAPLLALEVLSIHPRLFEVHNFFSDGEADQLIQRALQEQHEVLKLQRSTIEGFTVDTTRTSENAWETGPLTTRMRKRGLRALGFDEYYESHTENLQILRYHRTNAYSAHNDTLKGNPRVPYDYESGGRGGNRFATILMYMSDMEEGWGGETCFPYGERYSGGPSTTTISNKSRITNNSTILTEDDENSKETKNIMTNATAAADDMIAYLREQGELDDLVPGSWEENMTGLCRTRLAVVPRKSRAVLFYSQLPNGKPDPASEHGACPVLHGTKWAANLWAWNAAREMHSFAPLKAGGELRLPQPHQPPKPQLKMDAKFYNSGADPKFRHAALYWENEYFGDLSAGETVRVDTFVGHVWHLKHPETQITLHTWKITHFSKDEQTFLV